MLRTQPLLRSLQTASRRPLTSSFRLVASPFPQARSQLCTLSAKRPQICPALNKNFSTSTPRRNGKYDHIDTKAEAKLAEQKIPASPDTVSATSSIHPIMSEQQTPDSEDKVHSHGGIASDFQTIRETFNLSEVPREAYVLGLAGVVPYLATSMATIGVAYEINNAHDHGTGFLMEATTAEQLLHLLEPIQVGYGAVIISFLGAIHWGLEWANYGGRVGYPRYAIGVLAPAIAWPTVLLPVTGALITQFLAFNTLYYLDSRACKRGWTPTWYGTYRFVLTFIVGAAIVVSLIGRGELIGKVGQLPSPAQRVRMLQDVQLENLKRDEEKNRLEMIAKGQASEEVKESLDDEGEEEGEDGDEEKETGEEKKKKADEKEKPEKAKKEKEE